MQSFKQSRTLQNTNAEEVLQKLQSLLPANKFSVLHVHDVAETLRGKDFEVEPYFIVEFCRAPAAHKVLGEDPDIGLFLPCKLLVIGQGIDVRITTFLPTSIGAFFPGLDLSEIAQEVERDILSVMERIA